MEQPARQPIPDPLVATKQGASRATLQLRCPNCTRVFGRNQASRYELHWRLTHDIIRPLATSGPSKEREP